MGRAQIAYVRDGIWRTYGTQETPADPAAYRNSLVAGTFFPSATTVGIYTAESTMTVVTGNQTYANNATNNGRTIENTIFNGQVTVNAIGMNFRNCVFRGIQGQAVGTYSVSYFYSGVLVDDGSATFTDCLFEPTIRRYPALYGRRFTATRCEFRYCEDGVRVISEDGTSNRADVRLEGCWIHDLVCWADPGQSDGITHNDAIQWEGGRGLTLIGNRIEAFLTDAYGKMLDFSINYTQSHHAQGACLMINYRSAKQQPDELVAYKNWWNGGGTGINNSMGGSLTLSAASSVTENWIGYDFRLGSTRFLFGLSSNPMTYSGNLRWGPPSWVHGAITAGPTYTPTGLSSTKDPWDTTTAFTTRG